MQKSIKWQHGQESDFKLCVFAADQWLVYYSLDVRDKYRAKSEPGNEYNALQKMDFLQRLFEKGGSDGNGKYLGQHFELLAVKCAYIVKAVNKPSDVTALLKWTPQRQWHRPSQPSPTQQSRTPKTGTEVLGQGSTHSPWRLSLRLADKWENFSVAWENPLFAAFCDKFAENYARILDRFADENGEINRNFLMCAFLAEKAVALMDVADKAYIDHHRTRVLRIDRGHPWRLCEIAKGGAWAPKSFFSQF